MDVIQVVTKKRDILLGLDSMAKIQILVLWDQHRNLHTCAIIKNKEKVFKMLLYVLKRERAIIILASFFENNIATLCRNLFVAEQISQNINLSKRDQPATTQTNNTPK